MNEIKFIVFTRRGGKPATNRLSYGTAFRQTNWIAMQLTV
jgi:hypothetical protein